MGKWKYTIRKIRGVRRKVKVRKVGKREIVRVVNRHNYKDSTVPKKRLKRRVKNWVNYTDGARMVDHKRYSRMLK